MRALYAYIPVVHSGVLTFLREYADLPIFLLDNVEGKNENVYLERDIRALSANDIKIELEAHGFKKIEVVGAELLVELSKKVTEFIAPDDEIVRFFLEKYAPQAPVLYKNVFLRWTKQISTTEFEVPPDRVVAKERFSQEVLEKLNILKEESPDWWRQIAGALVRDGEIFETAFNAHYPSPHALTLNGDPRSNLDAGQGPSVYTSIHAEAALVAKSARRGISVDGCDVYVTTFPCPACARLLVEAGVRRVFYQKGYSLLDAENILKNAGVEIILVIEK